MRPAPPILRKAVAAVTVVGLLALGALLWLSAPPAQGKSGRARSATPLASGASGDLVSTGRDLFSNNCASCHGTNGEGTGFGPSLIGVGEASADFMLRTGRMPLGDPSEQATRKAPAFNDREIRQLDAYVGTLGSGGPSIPQFDLRGSSLPAGNDLFTVNCAPCHGVTGAGDAIGGPAFAPSLSQSSPLDVQEAVRIAPGQMPDFTSVLDANQIDDIARYVEYLQQQGDPGGANLGRIGPVPEGFVTWFLGAGVLVIITILFVAKGSHPSATESPNQEH